MGTSIPGDCGQQSDEESYFFKHSATLRIFGDRLDRDGISSALGLQPTEWHRKGDTFRGLRLRPYSQDMWSYDAPVGTSEALEKHIDTLWTILKPHKRYLLDLKKSVTVDVFLGYKSNCQTAGIEIPHTSLEMFVELELPVGISIIVV